MSVHVKCASGNGVGLVTYLNTKVTQTNTKGYVTCPGQRLCIARKQRVTSRQKPKKGNTKSMYVAHGKTWNG